MYQVTPWSHQSELPGDLGSAALAREFVQVHLVEHGFPGLVEDLSLVTSELAANAIVHAQTTFSVRLQGNEESVVLTVRDGSAFLPVVPVAQAMNMGTGGRGLAIVAELSDRWGTTPHADSGKSVWAWFDKRPLS
ncbi:MAG: ATP-binding protein [Mycobacteriaceae bacterium]